MRNFLFNSTDLRYTFRLLAKSPGFTLLSVIVLAGGLGVSIIAFTFSYTMFFKPLPITNGDSIYHVCAGPKDLGCRPFRAFEFAQLREDISTLENVGLYQQPVVAINNQGIVIEANAIRTEWNMFQLSQSTAMLGRTLLPLDQEANAEAVVVLAYAYWQSHFYSDEGIIGTLLTVDGIPSRVVGVMPENYLFPWSTQIWIPTNQAVLNPLLNEDVRISTFALLKEGVSEASADAEISVLMQRVREQHPSEFGEVNTRNRTSVEYLAQLDTGHIGNFVTSEFTALTRIALIATAGLLTGFIFLLACINVGTLLLARTNERLKDISIRVALGAPRKRLVLQLMGESLVISIIGGVLAVLFAGAVMESLNVLLSSIAEGSMAFWQQFHVDVSTWVGVLVFVLFTILLTSAIPCWRIVNGDFNAIMRDGTRGAVGLKPGRVSRALVVTAITIITLLLYLSTVAGSFALSLKQGMSSMNIGNIIIANPVLESEQYTQTQRLQFYASLAGALEQEPAISSVLFRQSLGRSGIEKEGLPSLSGAGTDNDFPSADIFSMSGSLAPIGANLLQGRFFGDFDRSESTAVVVVSRSFSERLWPEQSAIGQRLRVASSQDGSVNSWRTVVGVISDVISSDAQFLSSNFDAIYIPLSQTEIDNVVVQVRVDDSAEINAARAKATLSQAVLDLEPSLRTVRIYSLEEQAGIINQLANLGMNSALACSLFSFLVAIAGIFGLTQNSIRSSTNEIGTRRALGATDSRIGHTFLLRGSRQAITGFVLAMLIALPFTYLAILAFGWQIIEATLVAVIAVIALLYGTVLLAIYYPVRKVLAMEPSEALRHE